MLKKLCPTLIIGCLLLYATNSRAQLYINGAQFFIESGATVTVQGDITSNVDILGTGKILLKGTAAQNVNMNNFTIPNLEMDNVSNATLISGAKIGTDLLFTNGRIILGSNNLTMAAAATITTPGSSKFVVTDGTGKLIKTSLGSTAFTYPVGNTALTYNPVTISNPGPGVVDDIAVRCLANANNNGLTGIGFTKEVVDASWDVSEALAGGSNLSMTASWNATDELLGFNRNKAGISYYMTAPAASVGWDLLNSQTTPATGTNPYSYTRNGITTLGAFAVGTRPVLSPLLVSPKIFLQGAYAAGLMNDNLRTLNQIPTTEPYTSITTFTHSGSGGGETSTTAIVGSTAPAGSDAIVDWVFVQLHNGITGAVISTRAGLLQRDGDIVETDGTSSLNMAGNDAALTYYVSVRHRNHLAIRTPAAFTLAKTTTTPYNFTDNISKAYNNPAITSNPAMVTLAAGVYGMYGGNANSDATTRVSGSISISDYQRVLATLGGAAILTPTYSPSDVNMDGTVRVSGSISISDYQKILSFLNSLSILNQHL